MMKPFATSKRVNNRIKHLYGTNFPKGIHIQYRNFNCSKEGIRDLVEDSNPVNAFVLSRLMGLLDAVLTFIVMPIGIVAHTVIMVTALLLWFFCWPVWLMYQISSRGNQRFPTTMNAIGLLGVFSITSILVIPVVAVLSLFQFVSPELTVYVLKLHEWGELLE